jgi:hypothetical protein
VILHCSKLQPINKLSKQLFFNLFLSVFHQAVRFSNLLDYNLTADLSTYFCCCQSLLWIVLHQSINKTNLCSSRETWKNLLPFFSFAVWKPFVVNDEMTMAVDWVEVDVEIFDDDTEKTSKQNRFQIYTSPVPNGN